MLQNTEKINGLIAALCDYGEERGLISRDDRVWVANALCEDMHLSVFTDCVPSATPSEPPEIRLENLLCALCDCAVENGIIPDTTSSRDNFDTRLMGHLTPRPGEVSARFAADMDVSRQLATDNFYRMCRDCNYIRASRVARDLRWKVPSEYGDIDISINMSKPEKDPKAIAAAKNAPQAGYPKCMLCRECEGYAGRINFPARQNHRVIPITINGSDWCLQYSPYVYYNEHCIVFNAKHTPMAINRASFKKLLDFVTQFPHYFVGSNADLPIVGGSILSHDHFQGGNHTFAMAKAPIETELHFDGFSDIEAGIVKWPMSVIRLRSENTERLVELADKILTCWRGYSDPDAFIFAETDGTPHNTITPIARKANGKFELDLVLRNNITTAEHPLGVFHPHAELHHIKKENIGLIEVMGLAVLPARLKNEMALLEKAMLENRDIRKDEVLAKHADWADEVRRKHGELTEDNISEIIRDEIGLVFSHVLEHAGVFKRTEEGRRAFLKFAAGVNKCS